ncbi:RINT1-like protein MAG2 isoform X1 [Solanum pennellii]|uniref:RINT1-like protein MAG2 isoform X1 n=1 Tax=Solanum pennellii TaxID=28526 RepID=A0ABM1GFQ8_SOLPN|nr:RINT1-like protein MAG2 isoform X1 [Solanum pennellii]XP_027771366.1 RINT1-like protein MAG2 isoform X1 [Solanum pennellii]
MDRIIQTLPPPSSLSVSVVSFLNAKLNEKEDLEQAPALLSELRTQCHVLDQSLSDLNTQFRNYLINHASHSDRTGALLRDIDAKLGDLQSASCSSSPDGGSGKVLGEELPALAKEVARVNTVRTYAETALKLDTLVGDIEDAVSSTVKRTLRREPSTKSSEEMRSVAIRTLKLTEETLRLVAKTHPQWTRLVSAVDHRVDRALAILRPQAIADHRSLLTSLGWPPPLSTLNSLGPESKWSTDAQSPLFTMKGDLKQQYCDSFLALCSLQELQRQRKSRQLEGQNREIALHQPLWAIEELVNPISVASQRHFSKWVDKPEYIFALVYKVTRDYVDSMDELLQPLVDEAMLSGYSCREEWISAMVTSLSTYLAKEIFPMYVSQLEEESTSEKHLQARISWLHLIDQMMAFDKRVQSLASHSGILLSLQEDAKLEKLSSFSVFIDRPDWLDLWADIELTDAFDKLKPEIENERSWSIDVRGVAVLSAQEDNKSPAIASAFHQRFSAVIDRCQSLPSIELRSRFLKLAGAPIIHRFLGCLLFRCQEAEGLTALTDNDALMKVAKSVNAARCFESILKEWCEDIFFLEMGLNQDTSTDGNDFGSEESSGNGILYEEIKRLEEFRTGWVEKLSTVVLRGFDVCCRDYLKNKKQWQEKGEEGWMVSQTFVGALDYLQGKMSILEEGLNRVDFVGVWRSLAPGLDKLIFNGILMTNAKFSDGGVERLSNDLSVLFGVFGAWCLRPEGFFPKLSEGLKLLKMGKKQLQNCLAGGEIWLKENGIRHLTAAECEKIAKNRI